MAKAYQRVYTKLEGITKATVSLRAKGVSNDELAVVAGRLAQVVRTKGDLVTLQIFSGTEGIPTDAEVVFLGEPPYPQGGRAVKRPILRRLRPSHRRRPGNRRRGHETVFLKKLYHFRDRSMYRASLLTQRIFTVEASVCLRNNMYH